jgi:phage shock protein PspC (stress-responsive transcriptional regulator)
MMMMMKERKPTMDEYDRSAKRGLYRSRKGILLGVCRGVSDYFDFSVFWIRAMAVIAFIFTGFWPIFTGRPLNEVGAGDLCRQPIETKVPQPVSLPKEGHGRAAKTKMETSGKAYPQNGGQSYLTGI